MQTPRLLTLLPEDYVSTPDGMSVDRNDGNLILACPNFADTSMPGCVVKIDKNAKVKKWFDVPILQETGCARPMGIEMAEDGDLYIVDNQGWSGKEELVFKGRVLRVKMNGDKIAKCTVIAYNMEHPNGLRVKDGYVYVTQSMHTKVKDPSGKILSSVYKFSVDDENINITNTLEDKNILTTFLTLNPDCQYGADGIVFDKAGNLYVGNFGDGAVHRICFNPDGSVKENTVWAKNEKELTSTDGLCIDEAGNIYAADFSVNAIAKIDPEGNVKRIAQSPDTDGLNGELDQPGEPIVWNGKIIASCFDLVVDPGKVNTGHEMPATMSMLDLE
jgi:sugar lactone lactonase YvrE